MRELSKAKKTALSARLREDLRPIVQFRFLIGMRVIAVVRLIWADHSPESLKDIDNKCLMQGQLAEIDFEGPVIADLHLPVENTLQLSNVSAFGTH